MTAPALGEFDLVVLGGGPAGISGAGTAATFGQRVALVEEQVEIGGAGLNSGTVPSKTLRETAVTLSGWRARRLFGIEVSLRRRVTMPELLRHQESVSAGERGRVDLRLAGLGVERVHGAASFADPHTVRVVRAGQPERLLRAGTILIATGSSPYRPPDLPFDDRRVLDSDDLLRLEVLPERLVVVGAGVIGSEYACVFAALGVDVHLVDGRTSLLPFLDDEIAEALRGAMTLGGVTFHWSTRVTGCDTSGPGDLQLTLSTGSTLACSAVLVCSGRSSRTAALDLGAAGITPGRRGVVDVDGRYRTSVPHIYAAGDVIGPPALAATGMEQARVAMCHAFGITAKADLAAVLPTGVYTIPEVGMAGATEQTLRADGIACLAGRACYDASPRGRLSGDRTGFLKLLFRPDDMRLLGVHVIGEQATELVHIGLMAMLAGEGADLFNRACFNYPTLGDLYKYATYDALLARAGRRPPA
jgi:NAD(P) transhydrogenase